MIWLTRRQFNKALIASAVIASVPGAATLFRQEARASTCQLIDIETWDTFGTSLPPFNSISPPRSEPLPYSQLATSGPTYSMNSIAAPPWNPNGNGTFLRINLTGQNAGDSPGTGMYRTLPESLQAWCIGFWFRMPTLPTASNTLAVFRWNQSHVVGGGATYG